MPKNDVKTTAVSLIQGHSRITTGRMRPAIHSALVLQALTNKSCIMLTVTASMLHEKLQVGEDEIVLNGPPSDLRGQMFVTNSNNEPIKVRALPLVHDKRMSNIQPGLQQGLH